MQTLMFRCARNCMTPSLHTRHDFHRQQQNGGGYEDVSPEDLFNMFFGGMPGTINKICYPFNGDKETYRLHAL